MSNCFCVGKMPGCTCGGSCRCACTCNIDKVAFDGWFDVVKSPDLISEGGKKEIHRTKRGKGAVGRALEKYKKLPPNCS